MPNSLVVEGLAQTAGILIGEHSGWEQRVILAKISKALFHFSPVPGDTLTYEAVVGDIHASGAVARTTSRVGERLQAEVDFVYAHVDESFAGKSMFDPVDFAQLLRILGVFEVGRTADGRPIELPPALAEAERAIMQE